MKASTVLLIGLWLFLPLFTTPAAGYPIDGYLETGIRRLERLRLWLAGELPGKVLIEGARKSIVDIKLHRRGDDESSHESLLSPDAVLQRRIEGLFSGRDKSYSIAVLDITPGRPARYAALRETRTYQPGSVGKLAVAVGLFAELEKRFPHSTRARRKLLRDRKVVADDWILHDHHNVPIYEPEDRAFKSRPIQRGDVFTLYEWLDHMLSASSNAAASTVWKEAMLLRAFGPGYPPSLDEEATFFKDSASKELQTLALSIVNDPLRDVGIEDQDLRLGSFFTATGKKLIPSGGSRATSRGLLLFLLRMEQGRLVDSWSSLELKRLVYMTERRIRYASSPRLRRSAVYFKSGSLYRCKEEPDFDCGKYKGNVFNYMNSVAIVEKPEGQVYLVALMSNVLRLNSAVEHQSLAATIDRILIGPDDPKR